MVGESIVAALLKLISPHAFADCTSHLASSCFLRNTRFMSSITLNSTLFIHYVQFGTKNDDEVENEG